MVNAPPDKPVFRFAPSPNGALHLGHARSAILNDIAARQSGGRLLLRMENIDLARCTPELEHRINEDLDWLGIKFDGPVRRQSDNFDYYRRGLSRLRELGLVYPSFTTRGELRQVVAIAEKEGRSWPRDPDGAPHPPASERTRSEEDWATLMATGRSYAWRLDMDAALERLGSEEITWNESRTLLDEPSVARFEVRQWGDVVLARKDTPTSYHLAVVMDDAMQAVTHIVRGRDLYAATAIHRLLQRLLDLPEPVYHHHALILDEEGRKLSKSAGSTALSTRRLSGQGAGKIKTLALSAREAVADFTLPKTSG
ncbi:tRNA glutamyl-Q(34) synthetase GluQRS [Notoacmeibacter sp. MSK16QG-6]|uniref:tRNA glutamyl-Q(34) synthetase GluQRS n=1 Tax=Notoacmeibacter sp. MSK16QG-6 TaxID=2957982 RepID=UPI0020A04C61|nr:tRNA glutamyl-Q(34) synthetase GluQRS [Notoacmeibacter sp. MSK16QG-6]MCP1199960.1 tRNA glutamyl-Q(34) synthetase GluQRS [Notoacmeibacter sp. MSK16QG-6]